MKRKLRPAFLCTALAAAIVPGAAQATEGYFQNGISVRDKGVAGAGVADPEGPLAVATNPAGIAEEDSQVSIGASLFMPRRSFETSGDPGFTPDGKHDSGSKYFVIPSAAASFRLDDKSAIALALYGNGGLNTNWGAPENNACVSPPLPAPDGVFCGGRTGVNLLQIFASAGYARQIGDHITVGVAPTFAVQVFRARGLAAFSYDMMGNPLTVDPDALTDRGNDVATGFGVRAGILVKPVDGFRIGASYQSKFDMSRFDKYAGLFEGGGNFDIPSAWTLGVAADLSPAVTVMADYRHIAIDDVPAVANSSTLPRQFGSDGGPGFGWDNVDAYKFGIEGRLSDSLTLRGGYAHNNNPVRGSDATINILAPGVSTDHFTAGARLGAVERGAFDVSVMVSPTSHTRGIEITPAGANPGRTIDLAMHQFELAVSWTKSL